MLKNLLFSGLLLGLAGSAQAQSTCPVTITKSGTGLNRIYTATSTATGATYKMGAYTDWETIDSSDANTLSVNYTYGGQYSVSVEVTAGACTSYLSIKDTVAGPVNCDSTHVFFGINPLYKAASYDQFFVGVSPSPIAPPGYTKTFTVDYGDGEITPLQWHSYIFPQANAKVQIKYAYTHPTYPSCTITSTKYLRIPLSTEATNKITYMPVSTNAVNLRNVVSYPATKGYTYFTRWYLRNDTTGKFDFIERGNYLNYNFPASGGYTLLASTSWFVPNSDTVRISTDSVRLNIGDGSNHLGIGVHDYSSADGISLLSELKITLLKQDATTLLYSRTDSIIQTVEAGCKCIPLVSFHNLPAGNYLARAEMLGAGTVGGRPMVTTYATSAASWQDAQQFTLTSNTYLNTDIRPNVTQALSGGGFIGGTLRKENVAGDPVSNMRVLLRDNKGLLQKETYTDMDGNYAFSGLPDGTYEIYPEELNFKVQRPAGIFLSADLNLLLDRRNFIRDLTTHIYKPDVPSGVQNPLAAAFHIKPNPATDKLQISVAKSTGSINATLSNVAGQVVLQQSFTGTTTEMSVAHLPAGIYLLQLQNGKEVRTEKVQIQH